MRLAEQFLGILREHCKARGAQNELVKASGVSQPTLSRILAGGSDPTLKAVSALADAMGLYLCDKNAPEDALDNGRLNRGYQERIIQLERELAEARAELRGMERMGQIFAGAGRKETEPACEKKPELPEWSGGNLDAG